MQLVEAHALLQEAKTSQQQLRLGSIQRAQRIAEPRVGAGVGVLAGGPYKKRGENHKKCARVWDPKRKNRREKPPNIWEAHPSLYRGTICGVFVARKSSTEVPDKLPLTRQTSW